MKPGSPPPRPLPYITGVSQDNVVRGLMDEFGYDWQTAKFTALFLPDIADAHLRAKQNDLRLAHYTTSENAMKIADSKVLWLRHIKIMNDSREILHGAEAVTSIINGAKGRELVSWLDAIRPGAGALIDGILAELVSTLRDNTFICSLSEHDHSNIRERQYGRLSMWRAYARNNGVAVIANMTPMRTITDYFDAYSFPVVYGDKNEIGARLCSVVDGIIADHEFVSRLDDAHLTWAIESMLTYYCSCAKHPGFEEEREWRIVHRRRPGMISKLKTEQRTIGKTPQPVVEFPLDVNPPEGGGFRFGEVIDGVILGPARDQDELDVAREAIVMKLAQLGVTDAESKVIVSGIPFRE